MKRVAFLYRHSARFACARYEVMKETLGRARGQRKGRAVCVYVNTQFFVLPLLLFVFFLSFYL